MNFCILKCGLYLLLIYDSEFMMGLLGTVSVADLEILSLNLENVLGFDSPPITVI